LQEASAVEPADKRLPLVGRLGLVKGLALMERFDSLETSNLLARKTQLLKSLDVGHNWERLSEFHSHPPLSLTILPLVKQTSSFTSV
jgi:hypothetical protein